MNHIQGLIDHFFQDVEERVRAVLQPGILPPRSPSDPSVTLLSPPETKHCSNFSKCISPYSNGTFYTFPSPVPPPDTVHCP
ncbi:hypothetical protein JVU11DRAFT_12943 [Chiua virens]|nr:hypothetical protein JVU11DRAFT_12943 [Chiua virens]